MATSDEFQKTNTRLDAIETTLGQHTTALTNLATDVKKVLDQKTVSAARLDRLEHWAKLAGERLGIKLEV